MALQYQRQSRRAAPAATVIESQAPAPSVKKVAQPAPTAPAQDAVRRQVVPSSQDAPASGSIGRWVTIGIIVLLGVLVVVFGIFLYQTHNQVKRLETAQAAALNTDEVQGILQEQLGPVAQQFGQNQSQLQETQRQFHAMKQSMLSMSQKCDELQAQIMDATQKRARPRRAASSEMMAAASPAAKPPSPAMNPQAALLASLVHQTAAPAAAPLVTSPSEPAVLSPPSPPVKIPSASSNPFDAPAAAPAPASAGLTPLSFPVAEAAPAGDHVVLEM